mmetsp:Transcript_3144/g.12180  ORF Transcript_3144/g.12180 Transcript_3144/m.12180 type:complete len:249 (+) Transcript_3144:266-1012(+)
MDCPLIDAGRTLARVGSEGLHFLQRAPELEKLVHGLTLLAHLRQSSLGRHEARHRGVVIFQHITGLCVHEHQRSWSRMRHNAGLLREGSARSDARLRVGWLAPNTNAFAACRCRRRAAGATESHCIAKCKRASQSNLTNGRVNLQAGLLRTDPCSSAGDVFVCDFHLCGHGLGRRGGRRRLLPRDAAARSDDLQRKSNIALVGRECGGVALLRDTAAFCVAGFRCELGDTACLTGNNHVLVRARSRHR